MSIFVLLIFIMLVGCHESPESVLNTNIALNDKCLKAGMQPILRPNLDTYVRCIPKGQGY